MTILLLAAFSFPLIALPVVIATLQADLKLPACCRREGKHHCSMKGMAGRTAKAAPDSALSISDSGARCPLYPVAKACPFYGKSRAAITHRTSVAPPVPCDARPIGESEAYRPGGNDRVSRQRGPPTHYLLFNL